jgi:hypothetical protein
MAICNINCCVVFVCVTISLLEILLNNWKRSSWICWIIKAEVCVICRSRIIPHILREPNSIIVLLFICMYIRHRVNACIVKQESFLWKNSFIFSRFRHNEQHKLVWRHSVIYVFSIYGDVITPNLDCSWKNMTICDFTLPSVRVRMIQQCAGQPIFVEITHTSEVICLLRSSRQIILTKGIVKYFCCSCTIQFNSQGYNNAHSTTKELISIEVTSFGTPCIVACLIKQQ